MGEKCFCHLNGYAVKDATARKEIEALKEQVNNVSHVDSEARAAAAATQAALEAHVAAEVVDSTARSAILGLEEDFNAATPVLENYGERITTLEDKEMIDSTARSTANEAKSAAATNANSITGHETRITALESAGGGGLQWKKTTLGTLQNTYLKGSENIGKLVKIYRKLNTSQPTSTKICLCAPIEWYTSTLNRIQFSTTTVTRNSGTDVDITIHSIDITPATSNYVSIPIKIKSDNTITTTLNSSNRIFDVPTFDDNTIEVYIEE